MLPKLVPRPGKLKRAYGIVETLKTIRADIIVFQEAFLPEARDIIEEGLGSLFPCRYGPPNNSAHIKSSSGVWVLSRQPLRVLKTIQFTVNTGMDRLVRKGAILLSGTHCDKPFQLLAAHAQANDDTHAVRRLQMHQLSTELLQPFSQSGVPQIICADLNVPVQQATEYQLMLQELDAEDGPVTGPLQFTYDGFKNTIVRSLGFRDKLTTYDYVLLRRNGAVVKNCRKTIMSLRYNNRDLSDHYCILAEVEL
jgi:endonuclease/exonuclease/phosphatase family metal-dependent hydrolase